MSKNESIIQVSQAIEGALKECGVHAIAELPTILQAVRMAEGIRLLRAALTDEFVRDTIMPLQGTALGFLTDKDKEGGYPLAVVKDVSIESMLRGFRVVGNEFNIIGYRFYGTKAGFERHVNEYPGLSDLVMQPGVPVFTQDKGGALVPFSASWRLKGKLMTIDCRVIKGEGENHLDQRIPVRVNAGMGADAVIGKAYRKMLYRIYQRLNGSTYGAVDGDVADCIDTTAEPATTPAPLPVPADTPEGRRVKLPGKGGPKPAEVAGTNEYGNVDLPGSGS